MKAKIYLLNVCLALNVFICQAQVVNQGIIYNIQGPNKGAWDLLKHKPLSVSDLATEKDMVNTTQISDPQPFFRRAWNASNGTIFIKDKSISFDSANYDSVRAHFINPYFQTVVNVVAGDVYIARIRNSTTYALIQITAIADDGCSLLCSGKNNLDNIAFTYKIFDAPVLTLNKNSEVSAKHYLQENKENTITAKVFPNPMTCESVLEILPLQEYGFSAVL